MENPRMPITLIWDNAQTYKAKLTREREKELII
jgi:hypothetical protein